MKAKLTLFFMLTFLLFGCFKEKLCEDEPMCARVNGKLWWPIEDNDFKTHSFGAHMIESNNQFWIRGKRGSSVVLFGVIDVNNRIEVETYILDNSKNNAYYSPKSGEEFDTDAQHTGVLHITSIDRAKKTIAGTFYFKARNSVTGDVVDVSNGRFNSKYSEY